jgi:trehalose synthase
MSGYDAIVVHDPQPLALRSLFPAHTGAWFWRCHIDLTAPNRRWWAALAPFLRPYDQAIFSTPEYVPESLDVRADTALPCIDPFRSKNYDLEPAEHQRVQRRYGLDPDRPVMLQVSRFDPWKDPLGVVEAYRIVKRERPAVQLAYMASMASDDPEGREVYERVRAAAGDDPDVHLLALEVPAEGVEANARDVNAMQRGADVVLQKSIREGFGLTVAEALWKERPVVAGNVGGIRYQIEDGRNGYLVDDVPTCADRVLGILDDPVAAAELGRRGRATVRDRFLMTRLLEQYLGWFDAFVRRRDASARTRRARTA